MVKSCGASSPARTKWRSAASAPSGPVQMPGERELGARELLLGRRQHLVRAHGRVVGERQACRRAPRRAARRDAAGRDGRAGRRTCRCRRRRRSAARCGRARRSRRPVGTLMMRYRSATRCSVSISAGCVGAGGFDPGSRIVGRSGRAPRVTTVNPRVVQLRRAVPARPAGRSGTLTRTPRRGAAPCGRGSRPGCAGVPSRSGRLKSGASSEPELRAALGRRGAERRRRARRRRAPAADRAAPPARRGRCRRRAPGRAPGAPACRCRPGRVPAASSSQPSAVSHARRARARTPVAGRPPQRPRDGPAVVEQQESRESPWRSL